MKQDAQPPILRYKEHSEQSIFTPQNMLREARRQKSIPAGSIPKICLLDPDGDLVQHLLTTGQAHLSPYWACYHTNLYNFQYDGIEFGVVGCAVGASFAVLVAEEMFASGCELLISITSAGQITKIAEPPYFFLIEKALRDEGTSYHYLPPSNYAEMNQAIRNELRQAFKLFEASMHYGASWTTDGPFRETKTAICFAESEGILGVEMEAAALYGFAQAKGKAVICIAQITNQMALIDNDFEKADGHLDVLKIASIIAHETLAGRLSIPLSRTD